MGRRMKIYKSNDVYSKILSSHPHQHHHSLTSSIFPIFPVYQKTFIYKMHFSAAAITAILASSASVMAHPGHDVRKEIAERASFMSQLKTRDLSHCSAKLKARGIEQAGVARRAATAKTERKKRGISSGKP